MEAFMITKINQLY